MSQVFQSRWDPPEHKGNPQAEHRVEAGIAGENEAAPGSTRDQSGEVRWQRLGMGHV